MGPGNLPMAAWRLQFGSNGRASNAIQQFGQEYLSWRVLAPAGEGSRKRMALDSVNQFRPKCPSVRLAG